MRDHNGRRTRSPGPNNDDWVPGGNPWLLVGTIVGAKLATIIVILAASWSMETGGFVLASQWHWLLMIGVLVAAPTTFAIRLRRVRAKREALRRSEWIIADLDLPALASGSGGRTLTVVDSSDLRA